jgi:hypothetical protein
MKESIFNEPDILSQFGLNPKANFFTSTTTTSVPRARFEHHATPGKFIWVKFENVESIRQVSDTKFTLVYADGRDVMVHSSLEAINEFWGMGGEQCRG